VILHSINLTKKVKKDYQDINNKNYLPEIFLMFELTDK